MSHQPIQFALRCALMALLLPLSAIAHHDPNPSTNTVAPFDVASRYFDEVYNEANYELIDGLFTADYQHTSSDGRVSVGTEHIANVVRMLKSLFPELRMSVVHHADNGDLSMMVVRYSTRMPAFAAEAVRDQPLAFDETFLFWVRDGRIYRGQSYGTSAVSVREMAGFKGNLLDMVSALSNAANDAGSAK